MITKNLIVLIYFIVGIIYCIYYWYKYYEADYKKLKLKDEVEYGMACNLMLSIIIFWPIYFLMDIWRVSKKICDKYNKMINR
jgi:hypothetical protein